MPVEIDSESRPGSAISSSLAGSVVHMTAGSPPPLRPTTTSRRGGRSRSPVSSVPRGGEENPSSAAAAAAAAAKAYANGSTRRSPWQQPYPPPTDGEEGPHRYGGSAEKPLYPPPPPTRHIPNHWPAEETGATGYRSRGGGSAYPSSGYDPHRPPPPPAYREDYDRSRYPHPQHHREPPPSRYDDMRGRYGAPHRPSSYPAPEYRYSSSSSHRTAPPHHASTRPPSHRPIASPPDHRRPYARSDPPRASTTLVMGGSTPIHLPKSPVSQPPRGNSAASVFRGCLDAPTADPNRPENILLSMRTPSTSFEEVVKETNVAKEGGGGEEEELADPSPPANVSQRLGAIFERQRSGEGIRPDGSIDIAPSFPFLLNQSFDSFGDSFNVESTLQSDSFGFGRADSSGNDGALLRKNSSGGGGNFSTPFLAPSGSGGALTIGYSPVNSFGNVSSTPRNNIMIVGGQDPRSASPTEGLVFRSYSGGTSATRPLDDSHFRMSVGSFGGQSVSMGYNRASYADPTASPNGYYPAPIRSLDTSADRLPHFYILLRKYRAAFRDCTFLLPGVKAVSGRTEGENGDLHQEDPPTMGGHPYQVGPVGYGEPTPHDLSIARRRVESSICAFGGSLNRGRTEAQYQDNREAIFRGKMESKEPASAAVTPSSTESSTSTQSQRVRNRAKYEDALGSRYYENESRLSWEFEESPPIEVIPEDETPIEGSESGNNSIKPKSDHSKDDKTATSEDDQYCLSVADDADGASTEKSSTGPQAKMRYRCKLCGQPKQNHTCPFQQALARSIGTMVYPAVNAFTADEPGTIAASLSEMNNFVDVQKDGSEASPMRPSPDRLRSMSTGPIPPSAQVTPETLRSSSRQVRSSSSRHGNRKRMYSQFKGAASDQGDLLFVEAMELKPEQFRMVSQSKSRKVTEGYVYPNLPLPYAQRKRLSDNLFSLSNDVPKLTDECAQVLREAREKDMWDLAVAELMTQVIVIIHCSERDYRFEGLRQYLLTLGIAC